MDSNSEEAYMASVFIKMYRKIRGFYGHATADNTDHSLVSGGRNSIKITNGI
jgi:hypothetical protein